ncbi:DUF5643 domain-containing protein [Paenibacillus terreus]|uniref:DUF5643 domain-containing protein n=1 Tax=Paenibacillus terreus TaxID=1387834 RepID=A0ABV5BB57_9BACL
MKNVYKVLSSAALAGMLLGGIAWGSIDTAAEAKGAASTDTSKSNASNKVSSTQSGITINAANAMYDGNYLRVELKSTGKKLDKKLIEKIEFFEILVDGKSIYEYGGGSIAKRPTLGLSPGPDADIVYLTSSDASWLGGNQEAYPDKFKLTIKITLEGVKDPYTMEMPIQKSAEQPVVMKQEQTKKSGNLSMSLKQVRATSASTRLQWVLSGKDKEMMHDLMYDFVDDQGRELEVLDGKGTDENNANGDYYFDYIIKALDPDAKSITIKPFTPEMEDPNATSGAFKLDSNGEIIKNYNKDLEMTISVK